MANPWDELPDAGNPAPWADLPDAGEPAKNADQQAKQPEFVDKYTANWTTQPISRTEATLRGIAAVTPIGSYQDEIAGAVGAGEYALDKAARYLTGNLPEGSPSVADLYRQVREGAKARDQKAFDERKGFYRAGEAGNVVAQIGPKNIVEAVKSLPTLTKAAPAVLRGLFTPEALKSAVQAGTSGAIAGGTYALGASEADLTKGEVSKAVQDTLQGSALGGGAGLLLGGLTGAARGGLRASADAAQKSADTVREAQALKEPSRDKAVSLLGLEGKQNKLGGPERARKIAQKLYDEPFPDGSGKTWVQKMDEQDPESGLQFIKKFRNSTGHDLGAIREELAANARASVPAETLRVRFKDALGRLPDDVQGKVLGEVDDILKKATDETGNVSARGLRQTIERIENAADLDTSNLSTVLGKKAGRTMMSLRDAATNTEKELVRSFLPGKEGEYQRLLDQYGSAKAVELGAGEKLRRLNTNKPVVRHPAMPEELKQKLQDVLAPRTPVAAESLNTFPVLGPIGRKVAETAAPGLFGSYRPTMDQILQEALTAQQQRSQLDPTLRKLLVGGAPMAATGLGIANEDR